MKKETQEQELVTYVPPVTGDEGAEAIERIYKAGMTVFPIAKKVAGEHIGGGPEYVATKKEYRDMKAATGGWRETHMEMEDAMEHVRNGGVVGIVPWQRGAVCVDVDHGDHRDVQDRVHGLTGVNPFATTRTGRAKNRHLFYFVSPEIAEELGSKSWPARGGTFQGASGEFKGAAQPKDDDEGGLGAIDHKGARAGGYVLAWDLPGLADMAEAEHGREADIRLISRIHDPEDWHDKGAHLLQTVAMLFDDDGDVESMERALSELSTKRKRDLASRLTDMRGSQEWDDKRDMMRAMRREVEMAIADEKASVAAEGTTGIEFEETDLPEVLMKGKDHGGGVLIEGEIALLSGDEGIGKSSIAWGHALAAAAALAAGKTWGFYAGIAVRACKSCILSWEDSERIIHSKMSRLGKKAKIDVGEADDGSDARRATDEELEGAKEHYRVCGLRGTSGVWDPPPPGGSRPRLTNTLAERTALFDIIFAKAEASGERIIIMDPVESAFRGDSNARQGVRPFIEALGSSAERIGAGVLLVHHANKAAKGKGAHAGDWAAGAGTWTAASRGFLVLQAVVVDPKDPVSERAWRLICHKANHGPRYWTVHLDIDPSEGVLDFTEGEAVEVGAPLPTSKKEAEAAKRERNRSIASMKLPGFLSSIEKAGSHCPPEKLRKAFVQRTAEDVEDFYVSAKEFKDLMEIHGGRFERKPIKGKSKSDAYHGLEVDWTPIMPWIKSVA